MVIDFEELDPRDNRQPSAPLESKAHSQLSALGKYRFGSVS